MVGARAREPTVRPARLRFVGHGSAFGIEARGHALRSFDGAPKSWLIACGLAITFNVVETGLERVRFPSLFGLLVPGSTSPSRSSRACRCYDGARGGVEALWQLGLGVSWRQLGRPMLLL